MVIFRYICIVIQYKMRSSGGRTLCLKIFIKVFYWIVNYYNMKNLLNKEVIGTTKKVE